MAELVVTRLLQSPLGAPAPEGEAGDIVAVTDGNGTVYLSPAEYDKATETELRYLIASSRMKRGGRKL